MKKISSIVFMTVTMSGFSSGAVGEKPSGPKLGYVDVQKAIQSTEVGKKAKKELEAEFNTKKKKLESKEKELKELQADLEKKAMVLSDDVREKRQRELQEEFLKYQKLAATSQQEIQTRERELTGPIIEKMMKVVGKLGEADDYSMIFVKSEQNILWAKNELDLTDKVIAAFEKDKEKSK